MLECVSHYVQVVSMTHLLYGGRLEVEQKVPISHITGEVDATGTSDVCIILPKKIIVIDLKGGMIRVDAFTVTRLGTESTPSEIEPNDQMVMYADGCIEKFGLRGKVTEVTLMIVQPRLNHVSETTISIAQLDVAINKLRNAAAKVFAAPEFTPGVDQCKYCKASGNCAPQTEFVRNLALDGFDFDELKPKVPSVTSLGSDYELMGMVTQWAKAVSALMYRELALGTQVKNSKGIPYCLNNGRKPHRHWRDVTEVELNCSLLGIDDLKLFKRELISPAALEKVILKDNSLPKNVSASNWKALELLIAQGNPSPTVALVTDKGERFNREAISLEGFDFKTDDES
jgi:hypothetical protein